MSFFGGGDFLSFLGHEFFLKKSKKEPVLTPQRFKVVVYLMRGTYSNPLSNCEPSTDPGLEWELEGLAAELQAVAASDR